MNKVQSDSKTVVLSVNVRRVTLAAALALAAALCLAAPQVQGIEVVSPDGGFSYQLPKGWKLIDAAGARYKAAVDPARQAKIIVNTSSALYVTENENGTQLLPMNVERYRYEILRWAGKRQSDLKIIENSRFTTNAGQQGLRTLVQVKRNGVVLHETLYFFEHYARIVWVICSGPGDGSMDSRLDGIMKTFRSLQR